MGHGYFKIFSIIFMAYQIESAEISKLSNLTVFISYLFSPNRNKWRETYFHLACYARSQ